MAGSSEALPVLFCVSPAGFPRNKPGDLMLSLVELGVGSGGDRWGRKNSLRARSPPRRPRGGPGAAHITYPAVVLFAVGCGLTAET
jgi:hypothetical protein